MHLEENLPGDADDCFLNENTPPIPVTPAELEGFGDGDEEKTESELVLEDDLIITNHLTTVLGFPDVEGMQVGDLIECVEADEALGDDSDENTAGRLVGQWVANHCPHKKS